MRHVLTLHRTLPAAPADRADARPAAAANDDAGVGDEAHDARASDEVLVSTCADSEIDAGEREAAYSELFARYARPVYRFLGRYSMTDADELDDLVQKTFLALFRRAAAFRGESSVRTWIFGIAVNVARQHCRGETRRKRLLAAGAGSRPAPLQPDQLAADRQALARVVAAVERLPERLRVVFVLCDLEHLPGVEAAKVLGLRQGTVWRRRHEARKRLRAALSGGDAVVRPAKEDAGD